MLDTCPQCGYSLQGLPENHACPECGLRYDRDSEVYKHLNPVSLFAGMLGFLGGTAGMFNLARTFGNAGPFWRICIIMSLVIYFGAAAWFARYVYRLYRRGPLVAVLPEGLYVRLLRIHGDRIAWTNVSRVAFNRAQKVATLIFVDGRPVLDICGVFASLGDAQRFVSQVAARVELSRPDQA